MELLGLLIIWSVFGISASTVASNRGANGCAWLAIGFLLGPIGLALAFTCGARCPQCRQQVASGASVCPHCNVSLKSEQSESGASSGGVTLREPGVEALRVMRCPYCAETIQAAALKCRFCGETVKCMKCGKTIEPGLDQKFCTECGAVVKQA